MKTSGTAIPDGGSLAKLKDLMPSDLREFLEQLISFLPDEFRYRLLQTMDALPSDGDNLQKVLELVRSQWNDLRSEERVRFAIVGPSRTGKSSLLREIERCQVDPEEKVFHIVDTQGLDEFLGYERDRQIPRELDEATVMILVLDARYSLNQATLEMYERLAALNKTLLVVLNKIDLVENPGAVVREAREYLGANAYATSVIRRPTINRLLKAIVSSNPKALYTLTRNFPEFRKTICNGIVAQSSIAAGLVGMIPIPVSDMLPITAVQTAMLLKISRAFGFPLDRERARELVPMLAAGFLIREGGHRLRRRFPDQAKLLAVSVGGSWTYLLGQAAIRYFERMAQFLERGATEVRDIPM